ncbi:DUF2924 domain-containing protein, partial [Herbaspirillum sp. RTI4]
MKVSAVPSGVIGRIARLPDTPFDELKALWQQLFAVPLPTHNRQYLERRIAYRIQALDFAQRDPALLAQNKARLDALLERTKPKPKAKAGRGESPTLAPGTMLIREFAGATHRVLVLPDGQFDYLGK